MNIFPRHEVMAFSGGAPIRYHGSDVVGVIPNKNVSYQNIFDNAKYLGDNVVYGGTKNIEEIVIYENDATEFANTYVVGLLN